MKLDLGRISVGLSALTMALLLPCLSLAAIPNTVLVEGVLQATGGGPVADGDYAMTFSLTKGEKGAAVWTEGPTTLTVKSGAFMHALGATKPLDPAVVDQSNTLWLAITIGSDPPMARPLNSVFFAVRAGLAEGLACSGCVTAANLNAQVVSDLIASGGLAKVAKTGAFADLSGGPDLSGYAQLSKLATVATSGDYADLLGLPDLTAYAKVVALATVATSNSYKDLDDLPVLAKLNDSCGTGLLIKGLKADGSYECVVAMDPSALPSDGLDEISGGLLFNQFQEAAASTKTPIAVPDNNPVGISDVIDLPDFGLAQTFSITAEVTNSDTANLKITAIDPTGTKFVLWDKTAKGSVVKTTWPAPTKTVSGDLSTWIGKNPKGKWYLQVVDTAFLNNGFDGQIKSWSIQAQVQASNKVGVGGSLVLKNAADPPQACTAANSGAIYFDTKAQAIRYCAGGVWRKIADSCGNGILEPTEECDDGNILDGDGCSTTCVAAIGYGKTVPGASCADILTKAKAAGITPKDGLFWVDLTGGDVVDAFQVHCDMTRDGGGWMLALQIAPSGSVDATLGFNAGYWTNGSLLNPTLPTLSDINAVYATFTTYASSDGKVLIVDKKTSKFTTLSVPTLQGKSLRDRFNTLGKTNLTVTAGEPSPQVLMGFPAVSGLCGSNAPWMMNMLVSHSGARLGNDVASNTQTTNNVSTWPCYNGEASNLSYSGLGGTLESGRQWQDGYGSEALNRYRDVGGSGAGSHNGAALFVR